MRNYRSWIPKDAEEHIESIYESTGGKKSVEYRVDGNIVGYRWFREDGVLGTETPKKNGKTHGTHYCFDDERDGTLRVEFTEPFRDGLPHGTARQWGEDGKLMGTFKMNRGTGWDLWRHRGFEDKDSLYLSEARFLKNGNWHGYEWWLEEDQKSVHQEAHFWENLQHGIRREWNNEGKLKRGFPQYWLRNERVSKRQYLRACESDPNLPRFRETDNLPGRNFPPEVQAAIRQSLKNP